MNRPPKQRRSPSKATQRRILREFILRNSYVRTPDPDKRREMKTKYKKGHELRIVLQDQGEVDRVSSALRALGFRPGKPHRKSNQYVVPVYGRESVELWCAFVGDSA